MGQKREYGAGCSEARSSLASLSTCPSHPWDPCLFPWPNYLDYQSLAWVFCVSPPDFKSHVRSHGLTTTPMELGVSQTLGVLEQGGSSVSCDRTAQVSTCVVEGDCFLICADFVGSLAAVVPSILWGYSLNDERSLGIHMDSGVVPEKYMTYGGSIVIINIKLTSLVNASQ